MTFLSWLRNENRSDPAERRRGHGPSRRRVAARPRLEILEGRRVPSTLTVTSNLDDDGFVSPGDGTLRGEIAAAQSGDTIVFAPALNGKIITLGNGYSHDQLDINENLTIQGPGAGLLTVYGNSMSRVFQVDVGANVAISGLGIAGGDGVASYYGGPSGYPTPAAYDGSGGGILNLGTLTLSGCTVDNDHTNLYSGYGVGDHSLSGGGISNFGTLTLSGCTVTANSSYSWGGGIYNDGMMTLSGSAVSYNSAAVGGAIFNDKQGTLTILSSVVKSNTAQDGADVFSIGSLTISKDSKVGKISHK
jgi:hypothetical protein